MARPLRDQRPGYYHVTTRGNDGVTIYLNDVDRNLFLGLLRRVAGDSLWAIHAWCLMTNHFHLLVEISAENLASGMRRLNGGYAQMVQRAPRPNGPPLRTALLRDASRG